MSAVGVKYRNATLRDILAGAGLLKPPKELEAVADVVLNYRPKSKQPKPRKRKKAKR